MFCLIASRRGSSPQPPIVSGSSFQRGRSESAKGSRRLAYAFNSGVWLAVIVVVAVVVGKLRPEPLMKDFPSKH